MYDTKRDCFSVSFKWKLSPHAANVIHHRDLFLIQFICRRIPGECFLSLEMLCIFSLLANFTTLKQRLCFVLHISGNNSACEESEEISLEDKASSSPTVSFVADCVLRDGEGCCCSGCCCSDKLYVHTVRLVHGSVCLPQGCWEAPAAHPAHTSTSLLPQTKALYRP